MLGRTGFVNAPERFLHSEALCAREELEAIKTAAERPSQFLQIKLSLECEEIRVPRARSGQFQFVDCHVATGK